MSLLSLHSVNTLKMKNLISILFKAIIALILTSLSFHGYGQSNITFTPSNVSSNEVRKQGRGAFEWLGEEQVDIPVTGAPTADYDFYIRFSWGDIQNLNTGAFNYTYFDQQVQLAVNAGKRFNFGIMGFYPGAPTTTVGAGPESITVGGFGLSYPSSVHTSMQAEPTYKDVGVTSCSNPPIFAPAWCPNYNSANFRNAYNTLMSNVIAHLKATTYNGITGWKAVGYVEMREYGSTGEWTSFNLNTAASTGGTPASVPANLVAHDTTILNMCTDMIAMVPDKRITLTTNGLTGEGLFDFSVRDTVAVLIMNMQNNVGYFGIRRDCFAQTDSYVASFYENNTTVYGGVNFANFFLTAYQKRPWYNEPCSCCTSLPAGSGNAPTYVDAPRQARFYHIASFGNGNMVFIGTAGQMTISADSIQQASKYAGYRMIIDSGYQDTVVAQNASFHVKLTYGNTGVAAVYEHWIPTFQVRSKSTVLATFTSKADHYLFQPGAVSTIIDTFTMTGVSPGTDSLYLITEDTSGYWPPFIYDNTAPVKQADGSYLLKKIVITSTGAPVANAGTNQTITLPTNSVTLDGTGSTGTYSSEAWTQVSGPNSASFGTPTAITTTATGLIAGVYVFQLSLNSGASTSTTQVTVNPAIPPGVSIFTTQVPASGTNNDNQGTVGMELGMRFKSAVQGYINGVRFYKTSGNAGTHIGELYSNTGVRLAQATFANETATGWQTVYFTTPVAILANTDYVVSYFSGLGNYVEDNGYFTPNPVVHSPLTAVADGLAGSDGNNVPDNGTGNGPFIYTATAAFPNVMYKSANYWVDVVFSTSFIIGNGSGTVSLTSMTGHNVGDTALIATQTGTYTSLVLQYLNGIIVRPQSGRPIFTTGSTMCNLKNMDVGFLSFQAASGTVGIDMSCGTVDSSSFHNLYFQDWASDCFNVNGGGSALTYIYGVDSTYKQLRNTYDSITEFHCNRLMDGSAGYSGVPKKDVCREITFSRIVDNNTSSTSFQGVGVTGIFFHCTATNIKITDLSGRGASGDVGWISGTGWWHVTDMYKYGGPGYDVRIFPLCEYRDTGSNWLTTSAKFSGTEYGFVNYQFASVDSAAGQYKGTSAYCFNNTMGNQYNDTLGYWSTMFNLGQVAPNCHYYVSNNLGFAIGNNNNNNSKPPLIVNLGGWNTIAGDTSNNQYGYSSTALHLDSTTVLFTNSSGSFPAFYLTNLTPGGALNGGITNPLVSVDYIGNPMRTPPDLGYIQFTGTIQQCLCIPSLHKGFRKLLITH